MDTKLESTNKEILTKKTKFQTSGSSKSVRICIPKGILEIEATRRKIPLPFFIDHFGVNITYLGKDGIQLRFVLLDKDNDER